MVDPFGAVFSSVSDPGERVVAVVPSNTTDLLETPKALYVGTGGDIAMIGDNEAPGATATIWRNVPSGTTATDILAIL